MVSTLRDLEDAKKIITMDPVSQPSSGFHNATVDFIARRVEQHDADHHHVTSSKRLQLNRRRRKDFSDNFPCVNERFEGENKLKQSEIEFWVNAVIKIIKEIGDDKIIKIGDDFLKLKF